MDHKDNISGKWEAKIIGIGGRHVVPGSKWTAFITANQLGSNISGSFLTVEGLSGKIDGSIIGDEVTMTIQQGPIRPETFTCVAKLNHLDKQMNGTYSSADGGKNLQASFVAYKKRNSIITIKLFWWRYFFPAITSIVMFGLAIMSLAALPSSAAAAIKFYRQDNFLLCGISGLSIIASFISFGMWFFWTWGVGSTQMLYEDLPFDDLPLWGMILTKEVLIFTSINVLAIFLFLRAYGIM